MYKNVEFMLMIISFSLCYIITIKAMNQSEDEQEKYLFLAPSSPKKIVHFNLEEAEYTPRPGESQKISSDRKMSIEDIIADLSQKEESEMAPEENETKNTALVKSVKELRSMSEKKRKKYILQQINTITHLQKKRLKLRYYLQE